MICRAPRRFPVGTCSSRNWNSSESQVGRGGFEPWERRSGLRGSRDGAVSLPLNTLKAALRHTEWGAEASGRTRKCTKALRDTKVGRGFRVRREAVFVSFRVRPKGHVSVSAVLFVRFVVRFHVHFSFRLSVSCRRFVGASQQAPHIYRCTDATSVFDFCH